MKKRTRSILQELNTVGRSRKHNDHLIEATGNNIIDTELPSMAAPLSTGPTPKPYQSQV